MHEFRLLPTVATRRRHARGQQQQQAHTRGATPPRRRLWSGCRGRRGGEEGRAGPPGRAPQQPASPRPPAPCCQAVAPCCHALRALPVHAHACPPHLVRVLEQGCGARGRVLSGSAAHERAGFCGCSSDLSTTSRDFACKRHI